MVRASLRVLQGLGSLVRAGMQQRLLWTKTVCQGFYEPVRVRGERISSRRRSSPSYTEFLNKTPHYQLAKWLSELKSPLAYGYIPVQSSGSWSAHPKVDDCPPFSDTENLVSRYEAMRSIVLTEGSSHAGLGATLLITRGMAEWMRGWQSCTPLVSSPVVSHSVRPPIEMVAVLASMALACGGGS